MQYPIEIRSGFFSKNRQEKMAKYAKAIERHMNEVMESSNQINFQFFYANLSMTLKIPEQDVKKILQNNGGGGNGITLSKDKNDCFLK
jgi:hypothetical protein